MRTLRRMKRVFRTAAAAVAVLSIAGGPAFAIVIRATRDPPRLRCPLNTL